MIEKQGGVVLVRSSQAILDQRCEKSYFQKIGVIFWGSLLLWNRSRAMSSRKRPADSKCIDLHIGTRGVLLTISNKNHKRILKDQRRRIEVNDAVEEGGKNETSEGNLKMTSPSVFSKEGTTNSSKQGSPGNESEIIYQLSPGLLSLSPSEWIWPRSYLKVVWPKWLSGTLWLAYSRTTKALS